MKTINKLMVLIGAAGVLNTPSVFASFDGAVTMNYGTYHAGGGGEFSATSTSGLLGNFFTFCLEENEFFSPGGNYSYFINSGSVAGGVSGQFPPVDPRTGLTRDNISIGTAWLYYQFRAGGLALTSDTQAGDFQNAVWYLEGEGGANNAYVTLATQNAGTGTIATPLTDAQVKLDSGGAYGVVALNLFSLTDPNPGHSTAHVDIDGTTYYVVQDQLGLVPEASTMIAGALLLLPLGASTLRIVRKNRTA